jgi:hypothetical protein
MRFCATFDGNSPTVFLQERKFQLPDFCRRGEREKEGAAMSFGFTSQLEILLTQSIWEVSKGSLASVSLIK